MENCTMRRLYMGFFHFEFITKKNWHILVVCWEFGRAHPQ